MLLFRNRISAIHCYATRHPVKKQLPLLLRAKSRLAAIKKSRSALPDGVTIHVSESLSDRRSVFAGRACRLTHPSEVSNILSFLMTDKRIARASHPTINAWRCDVDGEVKQGSDDCGEAAAGGKLSDLLQLLDMKNVLVVVTRNFGGSQLGPDRFKHINQVAKAALQKGGFLDRPAPQKGI